MFFLVTLLSLSTFLTLIGTDEALAHIEVHCGQLSVEGYQSCEITHNNQVINYTGPERKLFPELRFGLITYKCDHMAGHLVSEFNCETCDFYCLNEEPHEDCHEDSTGTWVGFFIGAILSCVFNFCIFKVLGKCSMLATVIVTMTLLATVGACDYTIVMRHNVTTMFCDDTKCSSFQPPAFPVSVGEKVCIDDVTGERVTLEVSEITYRSRYALAYYISDYKWANVTVIGNCCSCCPYSRQKCFDETEAKMDEKYEGGKKKTKGFDWDITDDHSVSCMYFGQNERVGKEYPIYQMVGQTWIVNIVARKNNDVHNLVLSSYDPIRKSIGWTLYEIDQIPISVTRITERQMSNVMLYYNDNIFYNSAENNFFLGDSDLEFRDLAGMERYPAPEAEYCTKMYEGCSCNCSFSAAKSKMSQFIQKQNDFIKTDSFLIRSNDESTIDTFDTFKEGGLLMRIGDRIEEASVNEAKCDFQLLTTYACMSCNESSYIVLQAQNIEQEGRIPIYSNCSFENEYVNCDFEPTKLILKDNYSSCFIGMPAVKKTVLVEVKYNLPSKLMRRENCSLTFTGYGEAFEHLFTSNQFIGMVAVTVVSICSLFSLLILILMFLSRDR